MSTPRIRTLLRQADRAAAANKRSAAAKLYRQLLDEAEANDSTRAAVWAGLGDVLLDESEREDAYQKALALHPENERAQTGLAVLRGEAPAEKEQVEPEPEEEESVYEAPVDISEWVLPDGRMVCYCDPDVIVSLRCNRCGRPICGKCSRRTSVGYRCLVCIREIEEKFYTATARDYIMAFLVAAPLSFVAGWLLSLFGGGSFFFFFIILFVGGAVGSFIARGAFYAAGRRRGRYMPQMVAGLVAVGGLAPGLLAVAVTLLVGGGFPIFVLLLPGLYSFVAASAAYYQMR